MHPVCFHVGSYPIHWFGVMLALGFLAGLLNWTWLGRSRGRDFNYSSDLLFWIMVSGVLGARLAYIAANFGDFLAEPLTIFRIDQGGLIFYGGLLGAGTALLVFARRHGENIWSVLDFVVTSAPLAHAFGRVGCVMNGCCYGSRYDGALAIQYPAESLAWWRQLGAGLITRADAFSLPVHPVQLYEACYNLAVYALLVVVYRRRKRDGVVSGLYLLAYPLGRFCLEFLRGDDRVRYGTPLSVAQYVSLLLFILGCGILVHVRPEREKR